MLDKIKELKAEIEATKLENKEELEAFRLRFISRKSVIGDLMGEIRNVEADKRKEVGQSLNVLKNLATGKFKEVAEALEKSNSNINEGQPDLTLPDIPNQLGTIHPISQTRDKIVSIFQKIGFNVADGPEVEDDWHNFTALNFPPNHPAREMQDTFFVEKNPDMLLRTHTSNVQIRMMETQKPPLRSIMPGRVFRNEAISARAHCIFHQIEGLYINENVSFQDLKNTLYYFAKEMFGPDTKIRLRPSYFPFTEPSAEMDIYWGLKTEADRKITKGTGWLEILGCGMVDPNVLANCGIDPERYTGFAFGMGIERITMLKHKIEDIRLFFENDTRFLRQFQTIS
ncbi:phenylalanine--tRNA ligase subunit alpha [Chondrinema litorale]|uniref:phenylalanine--tRNA ligase subunit alpha n=1 Tax=Chondrinema litorale TaxID=2994555 RepID=UPI0025427818|nr:phenylalanine--tRNA ligase subunit alpha [Chondrinema litorale]UZR96202.1 phenylalanine--tRNA ligase subunit alpha [Chondrinema litorale]